MPVRRLPLPGLDSPGHRPVRRRRHGREGVRAPGGRGGRAGDLHAADVGRWMCGLREPQAERGQSHGPRDTRGWFLARRGLGRGGPHLDRRWLLRTEAASAEGAEARPGAVSTPRPRAGRCLASGTLKRQNATHSSSFGGASAKMRPSDRIPAVGAPKCDRLVRFWRSERQNATDWSDFGGGSVKTRPLDRMLAVGASKRERLIGFWRFDPLLASRRCGAGAERGREAVADAGRQVGG
jgi:hypothetical protein